MHYYQFNIADYRKDTQHLNPIEHYVYRELMDWYYLDESPIPKKTQSVMRRLRLVSENNQDLQNVLEEFFTETEEGWVHGRIEREIDAYQRKVDTAKANGSKGGRPKKPKKTQSVNLANPEKTGSKANHKPITNNHKPINNTVRFTAPTLDEVKDYFLDRSSTAEQAERFINFYESKGWMVGKTKMQKWKAAASNWINKNAEVSSANIRPISNTTGTQRLTPAQQLRAEIAASRGGT